MSSLGILVRLRFAVEARVERLAALWRVLPPRCDYVCWGVGRDGRSGVRLASLSGR